MFSGKFYIPAASLSREASFPPQTHCLALSACLLSGLARALHAGQSLLDKLQYLLTLASLPVHAVFNIAAIIGLIPVYDRVFVPLLHRFGKKLTLLQRIGAHVSGPSSALFYPACCDDAFSLANSTLLRLCIKDCAVFPTPKQL